MLLNRPKVFVFSRKSRRSDALRILRLHAWFEARQPLLDKLNWVFQGQTLLAGKRVLLQEAFDLSLLHLPDLLSNGLRPIREQTLGHLQNRADLQDGRFDHLAERHALLSVMGLLS